ncbi:hypothetical protein THIOKS13330003 [Thiocapsa sp. KS1]|nr:hypothetical protein THIOKS13330003 [Thiocapsa sp. KS1]
MLEIQKITLSIIPNTVIMRPKDAL